MDHFQQIAHERRELADLLDTLDNDQWSTQSLCDGWTVRGVATHLTMPFELSIPKAIVGMIRHRGNFNRLSQAFVTRNQSQPTASISAKLRANAQDTFTPPGADSIAPLSDIVLHGQDIRRPLGISHDVAAEVTTPILEATFGGDFKRIISMTRFEGLSFRATDSDWSIGTGPEVTGTGEQLAMTGWGRTAVLDELGGAGAADFGSRF